MRRAVYEFPAHITVEEATRAYMEAAGGVQTERRYAFLKRLINFLNVWKWKQTLNGVMRKREKMFSEMTQKYAKAVVDAANIYGGKNENGHGGGGACARSFVCRSE